MDRASVLRARGAAALGLVATVATVFALWPGAGVPAWPGASTGLVAIGLGLGPGPGGAKACATVLGSMAAAIGVLQLGALATVAGVLP
jgi:hypothetical protein